jgi:hypothetical protein
VASASSKNINDRLLLQAASRLTERDRYICGLLCDHQVLTTHQIRQVCFESQRRTTLRLAQLHKLRVLDRFRPLTATGSAPHHWILDTLGAHIVAADRGVDICELAWRRDKTVALAASGQLGHLVESNGLFCSLLADARHHPDHDLVVWWSARRCAGAWGHIVRPDGYAVWAENGRRVAFLLEYDKGTERIARLADKVDNYNRLFTVTSRAIPVLFAFPGPRREATARSALHHPGVPVFTTTLAAHSAPSDAVWLAANTGASAPNQRIRLIDLTQHDTRRSIEIESRPEYYE